MKVVTTVSTNDRQSQDEDVDGKLERKSGSSGDNERGIRCDLLSLIPKLLIARNDLLDEQRL